MQDPNEDTEWNAALRRHGILPAKEKEITEEEVLNIVEATIEEKQSKGTKSLEQCNLDELDELEDEEDERVLLEYRRKRIAEMQAEAAKSKFGEVKEISGQDYVQEVNKAGENIWVVLHLYKQGIPLCALLNQHLSQLAAKFPATKFLKSISTTCIPNFPDSNLPTIFIYYEGELVKQMIGPLNFRGMNMTVEELEWILGEAGAVKTTLEEDPRPKIKDVLFSKLKNTTADDDSDDNNDW